MDSLMERESLIDERESLMERESLIDERDAIRYLSPIKSRKQLTEIHKFVTEEMKNEDSEVWKVFFNPAVLKHLKVNEDLFDESDTSKSIKKILIQKLVLKTIFKNCRDFYDKYEKEQEKQERIAMLKVVVLQIYIIFFVIGSIMYSVNLIYDEIKVMNTLLTQS